MVLSAKTLVMMMGSGSIRLPIAAVFKQQARAPMMSAASFLLRLARSFASGVVWSFLCACHVISAMMGPRISCLSKSRQKLSVFLFLLSLNEQPRLTCTKGHPRCARRHMLTPWAWRLVKVCLMTQSSRPGHRLTSHSYSSLNFQLSS